MKIGALLIFKNESHYLQNYMNNVNKFADFVVGYDDKSHDDSKEIFIKNGGILVDSLLEQNFSNGGQDNMRNLVLEEGRSLGGTHFCVLDADERLLFASNIALKSNLNSLLPGQKLALDWINIWGNLENYCTHGWPWAPRKKAFFFRDEKNMSYPIHKKHKDSYHLDRLPNKKDAPRWLSLNQPEFGVLHLQHANFELTEIKKIWYQFIELRQTSFAAAYINQKYDDSKKNLAKYEKVPSEWNLLLSEEGNSQNIDNDWRLHEILEMIDVYGIKFFEKLNVWDNKMLKSLWHEIYIGEPQVSFTFTRTERLRWAIEKIKRKIG